jgi:NAD+ kinase
VQTEVVLVYKKSQLRLALENRNSRIKRLLKRSDPSVRPMRAADEAHEATIAEVERALKAAQTHFRRVYRARLRPAMTAGKLVIAVGGDGTLLDTSHKIAASHVLGVNSDPVHSVGFLCASHRGTFEAHLDAILGGRWRPTAVRRLHGAIDDVPLPFPLLNDALVAHHNPAATSRYLIEHAGRTEDHKSSGVWISTAAGSTAAMASAGGKITALDDDRCQVQVREPFVADGPLLELASLWLPPNDQVVLTSKMREGRVYLDGPHEVLPLHMGARLVLHGRAPPLQLFATQEMAARRAVAKENLRSP